MKLGKVLGKEGMRRLVDVVLAEVDQFYMELPTDADGNPVRLGDMVAVPESGIQYQVTAIKSGGCIEATRLLTDGDVPKMMSLECYAKGVLKVEE